jgi:DNA-directed RNA polymerase specialized sigma24 family protein
MVFRRKIIRNEIAGLGQTVMLDEFANFCHIETLTIFKMTTNEEVLEKMMENDSRVFFKLYNVVFDPVYRYAVRRVGRTDYLKRLVNRTFYRAYHQLDQYFEENVSFRLWVLRHAKRVADEMGAPMRADVEDALTELDQRDLEMVFFKNFEGLPDSEVAYILDVEESAFTPLYYRLLSKLKSKL